jgi:RNA polymerase sigma factor (sigma-70 family)
LNSIAFILPNTERAFAGNKIMLSEDELIDGLQNGDQSVLEELYDRYSASLYGVILRIVKKEEFAEDILQETFVRIWQNARFYNSSKGRLFTWMQRIAKNFSLDTLRSKDYRNSLQNDDISEIQMVVDRQVNSPEQSSKIGIRQLVMRLNPKYSSILNLIYFQGYTCIEAAKELNIPVGTLKTRMRTAICELRNHFN